jgi:hypothetical protein
MDRQSKGMWNLLRMVWSAETIDPRGIGLPISRRAHDLRSYRLLHSIVREVTGIV